MQRLTLSLFLLATITAHAQVFRAGAVATDISPTTFPRIIAGMFTERTSDKLTDKLHSRAIVLDDGKMKIAFAIVDQCMMEQKLIDEAKALASKQCGIPVDRMMVSATHTHSAPAAMGCLGTRQDPEYAKFLIPKIAESIVEANKRLQPAKIGWSSIDDWEHTHNRRWIRLAGKEVADPFGNPTGRANMHPGYLSKDVVGPSGPVDPQLSVISIQTKDGKPLAVLANYSQHYFGSTPVSADYFGLFCDLIEKHLGGGVCAMSQGTSGDLMWMDYGAEKRDYTLQSYTEGVVAYAKKALTQVKYQDHAELGMVEEHLTLKYRTPDKKRLTWAQRIDAQIQNDLPKDKTEVYAREAVILDQRKETTLKLQAIRIGDLSIATLPNEVYAITGLKLKAWSPFKAHFNIELANGAEGYIPPLEQHELGGYTTWPARTAGLEENAEFQIASSLTAAIEKLNDNKGRQGRTENGVYVDEVAASAPLSHFRFESFGRCSGNVLDSIARRGGQSYAYTKEGGSAFFLPGPSSGLGYGDESTLKTSAFSGQNRINRCVQLAGGVIEALLPRIKEPGNPISKPRGLMDKASIALWFWLGHESGASDRSGHLIDALGATLVAHQFADHTVTLEWASRTGVPPVTSAAGILPADAPTAGKIPVAPATGGTPVLHADDWHFAVLIREGEQLRVHLDGSEQPILTGKAGENTKDLIFGQGLQGRLDEITVWDRAIDTKLIAQLWKTSKVEEDNARHAAVRSERAKKLAVQKEASLKQHENWSVSMRFRNTKPNNVSAVTAYLVSRGPKGDHQAPGDHLGIGGNYKDSEPGKIFVFNGNAADQIVRGKTSIEPGTWNDVKLERTGSHVKVTLNGKVEIDTELPVTAAGAKELFFGRRCDDLAPLEGEYENVVVTGLESGAAVPAVQKEAVQRPAPLSPGESLKKLHVREGFKAELIACEPVVLDPVAFDWDERGRLWVIEMADYPLGMDGKGKPGSRVVMLEDTDANGQYDKRTVIADGLNFATGILTWRDGVLVTAAPDVLFIKGAVKKVLLTGFSEGNQQLRVNGLRWGMDGWVYCAGGAHTVNYNKSTAVENKITGEKIELGARDFRFKPDTGEFDPQTGPSQFGRVRDDWDHWFGVQNSKPLWHYVLQDHYLRRNPNVIPPDPVKLLYPLNPPVYAAGEAEKRFHSFNQSGRYTSACGINFYRGGTLFDDGKMHAFTCEPFHRVVQHHILEDDGVSFKAQVDTDGKVPDFFASEDRWCRPVMVRDGPDGAIYVADMYRYMIEHPQWLPQNGKDELLPFYRDGDDKGRIYRISRDEASPTAWNDYAKRLGVRSEERSSAFAGANGSASSDDKVKATGSARSADSSSDAKGSGQSGTSSVVPQSKTLRVTPRSLEKELSQPITALSSSRGWLRDKAQMLIAWSKPTDLDGQLIAMACDGLTPQARAQAAWTLHILGKMTPRICERLLIDPSPRVREQGLIIAESFADDPTLVSAMVALADDEDAKVRLQLACSNLDHEALSKLIIRERSYSAIAASALITLGNNAPVLVKLASASGLDAQLRREIARALPKADADRLLDQWFADLSTRRDPGIVECLAESSSHMAKMNELAQAWLKSPSDLPLALSVFTRTRPSGAYALLTEHLDERPPGERAQIVSALLSHVEWTRQMLDSDLRLTLDAQQRASLLQHPNKNIAKLAIEVLQSKSTPTRAAVLEKFKPALSLTGDAAKGKQVFTTSGCIACHQLEGAGLPVGPDLRSVVSHTPEKLLNSILDPSAIIEPGFAAYHCTLKSGEQLYGIVATETSSSLTMKLAGNIVRSVLRSEVKELKSTQTSLMPDGLEGTLTSQSLADLIAYLRAPKP